MRRKTTVRVFALLLVVVMVAGLGTAALGSPINQPDPPFNLRVHHLIHPTDPSLVVPGTPQPGQPPLLPPVPPGTALQPVEGALWEIVRVQFPIPADAVAPAVPWPGWAHIAALEAAQAADDLAAANTAMTAINTALAALATTPPGVPLQATTNAQGEAAFLNIPAGIYFVRQVQNPLFPTNLDIHSPFFVSVPLYFITNDPAPGDGEWLTDVNVYPKMSQPDLDDQKEVFNRAGDFITWEISFALPSTLPGLGPVPGTSAYIRVDDRLSNFVRQGAADLTAIVDSVVVQYLDDNGDWQNLPVAMRTISTVASPTPAGDAGATPPLHPSANTLRVDINQAGRNYLVANADLLTGPNLRVRLTARTVTDVAPNTLIPNLATIRVGPLTPGTPYETERVFSLRLIKVDPSGGLLQGAVFRIYDQNNIVESPVGSGNWIPRPATPGPVGVPMDIPLAQRTTGANGQININGLTVGRYVIVEEVAPAGFVLNVEPITIVIDATTVNALYIREFHVENSPNFQLPMTGGAGTILFTIVGLSLIGGSILLLVIVRKRAK